MIAVNLLPKELRKRGGRVSGWPAACLVLLAALLATLAAIAYYSVVTVPALQHSIKQKETERRELSEKLTELKQMQSRAGDMSRLVQTVKTIYGGRVVWSKVLHDVREAVTLEQKNGAVWLTRIAGYDRLLTIDGVAASQAGAEALREVIRSGPTGKMLLDGWPKLIHIQQNPGEAAEAVSFSIELRFK